MKRFFDFKRSGRVTVFFLPLLSGSFLAAAPIVHGCLTGSLQAQTIFIVARLQVCLR